MRRAASNPGKKNASRDIGLAKRFGLVFNAIVVVAFILGLFCGALLGLQPMREHNVVNVLLAPLYYPCPKTTDSAS